MILGYLEKGLIDEVFQKKEEQKPFLEIFMATENECEEAAAWKTLNDIDHQIDKIIKRYIGNSTVKKSEHFIFEQLFKAVGDLGKDKFLKALEVYEIGVKDDEDNEERTSIAN